MTCNVFSGTLNPTQSINQQVDNEMRSFVHVTWIRHRIERLVLCFIHGCVLRRTAGVGLLAVIVP